MRTIKPALFFLALAAGALAQPITADIKLAGKAPSNALTPLPTPRGAIAGGIVADKLYVIGGWVRNGALPEDEIPSGEVDVYDFGVDRWAKGKPMPAGRSNAFSAVAGGKIFVLGGCAYSGCPSGRGQSDRVDIYDPAADAWSEGSPAPHPRFFSQAAVVEGLIYLPGGCIDGKAVASMDVYDPASDRWSVAPAAPFLTDLPSAAALGGKVYVVDHLHMQIFDAKTKRWSVGPLPPNPRFFSAAAAFEGKLHLLGGSADWDNAAPSRFDQVYDPRTGRWSVGPPMVNGHVAFAGAFGSARRLAAVGGMAGRDFIGSLDILEHGAKRWKGSPEVIVQTAPELLPPPARAAPSAVRSGPVADVDLVQARGAARPDDFAVVVGIDDYRGIPRADYGRRDAEVFARYAKDLLGVPEENVILLSGEKAARTDLSKYIEEWLPRNVTPDSRVYFYFSGHGAPDPARGTAYLVPWDGDPAFLESSGYPLGRLYRSLGALKAKEAVVLLDACFSGAGGRSVIAKGLRPLVTVIEPLPAAKAGASGARVSVLSAASDIQIAGSLEEKGHGLFTYYLLKGLKSEARDDDGHLELGSLFEYVRKNVRKAAHRQNREQDPRLQTSEPELRLF